MEFETGSPGSPDEQGRQLAWTKCGKSKFEMELRSVEAVVAALNAAEVRYLIVGGLAVNAHGYLRATRDLDLVIQLESDNLRRGLQCLFEIGYRLAIPVSVEDFADASKREAWRDEKGMIVLKLWSDDHRRTPVDVFVYEPFDFYKEFEKACLSELQPGIFARIVSLEALIEMKLVANRPHDLMDVEELRRVERLNNEKA